MEVKIKDNVIDINALPSLLFRLFSTARVSVSEVDGGIYLLRRLLIFLGYGK